VVKPPDSVLDVPGLRYRLNAEMAGTNIRRLSREVGVSHVTLYAFAEGADASTETLGKIRDYFRAKDAPKPSAGDPSWQLALKTMRAQAQLVYDLAQKTQEAQLPVLNFLKAMEEGYARSGEMPKAEDPTPSSLTATADETIRRTQEQDAAAKRTAKPVSRRKV
jgi:hypothetical protein